MNTLRWRMTLCSSALLAATTLTGCMSMRPQQYNRRSFHAFQRTSPRDSVSQAQLARWHRQSAEQHFATATANSPKELDASLR